MRRLVLAHVLVIIALLLQIPSPQPIPAPTKSSQNQQDERNAKSTKGNRPERPNPSMSALIDGKSENHKTEGGKEPSPDWWIICLTGALVLLACAQFWAMHRQAEYMRRGLHLSIRQTRLAARNATASQRAADAAKMSAEIAKDALGVQKAFIQVVSIGLNRGRIPLANEAPVTDDAHVMVVAKNHGPTSALNMNTKGTLRFVPGNKFTIIAPPMSYDLPSAMDVGINFDAFNSWLGVDDMALLKQAKGNLQVSLKITYADIFRNSHETEMEATLRDWVQRGWEIKVHST